MSESEYFFAPCPRGLEGALAVELATLGGNDVRAVHGGVEFTGPYQTCYNVNLESRIASRVLWGALTIRFSLQKLMTVHAVAAAAGCRSDPGPELHRQVRGREGTAAGRGWRRGEPARVMRRRRRSRGMRSKLH